MKKRSFGCIALAVVIAMSPILGINTAYAAELTEDSESIEESSTQALTEPVYMEIDGLTIEISLDGELCVSGTPTVMDGQAYALHTLGGESYFKKWSSVIKTATVDIEPNGNLLSGYKMFEGLTNLKQVTINNASGFDKALSNTRQMFDGCTSLESIRWYGRSYENEKTQIDLSNLDFSNNQTAFSMFNNCDSITNVDFSNTTMPEDIDKMFSSCANLSQVNFAEADFANTYTMEWAFINCESLSEVLLNDLDLSSVTRMSGLCENCKNLTNFSFYDTKMPETAHISGLLSGCEKLESVNFKFANDNLVKVNDFKTVFNGCKSIKEVDLSSFDFEFSPDSSAISAFDNCIELRKIITPKMNAYVFVFIPIGTWVNERTRELLPQKNGLTLVDDRIDGNTCIYMLGDNNFSFRIPYSGSAVVRAVITDNEGRLLADKNVSVKAKGQTDTLFQGETDSNGMLIFETKEYTYIPGTLPAENVYDLEYSVWTQEPGEAGAWQELDSLINVRIVVDPLSYVNEYVFSQLSETDLDIYKYPPKKKEKGAKKPYSIKANDIKVKVAGVNEDKICIREVKDGSKTNLEIEVIQSDGGGAKFSSKAFGIDFSRKKEKPKIVDRIFSLLEGSGSLFKSSMDSKVNNSKGYVYVIEDFDVNNAEQMEALGEFAYLFSQNADSNVALYGDYIEDTLGFEMPLKAASVETSTVYSDSADAAAAEGKAAEFDLLKGKLISETGKSISSIHTQGNNDGSTTFTNSKELDIERNWGSLKSVMSWVDVKGAINGESCDEELVRKTDNSGATIESVVYKAAFDKKNINSQSSLKSGKYIMEYDINTEDLNHLAENSDKSYKFKMLMKPVRIPMVDMENLISDCDLSVDFKETYKWEDTKLDLEIPPGVITKIGSGLFNKDIDLPFSSTATYSVTETGSITCGTGVSEQSADGRMYNYEVITSAEKTKEAIDKEALDMEKVFWNAFDIFYEDLEAHHVKSGSVQGSGSISSGNNNVTLTATPGSQTSVDYLFANGPIELGDVNAASGTDMIGTDKSSENGEESYDFVGLSSQLVLTLSDGEGNSLSSIKDNPITMTFRYTDKMLSDKGISSDEKDKIKIYRYSSEFGGFVEMECDHNKESQTVSTLLVEPGLYILAVDRTVPIIDSITINNPNDDYPTIDIRTQNINGFKSFSLKISGDEYINKENVSDFYEKRSGIIEYTIPNYLPSGTYNVTLECSDENGNLLQKETSFARETTPDNSKMCYSSLTLGGEIGINTYIKLPESIANDRWAYVVVENNVLNVRDLPKANIDGEELYLVSVNVPAKNIRDEFEMQIYDSRDEMCHLVNFNGEPYKDDRYAFSVSDYAELVKSNSANPKLSKLMDSLMLYGDLAADYLGTKELNDISADQNATLAAVTSDVLSKYKAVNDGAVDGIKYCGSSLILDSKTKIRHYFAIAEGSSKNDFTFTVDDNEVVPVEKDGLVYIEKDNISSGELSQSFTAKVAKGGKMLKIDYSVLSYAYKVLEKNNNDKLSKLAQSLYLYSMAADDYFGVKDILTK